METRTPRASISLYAGRQLEFVPVEDSWFELRADDGTLVARLRPVTPDLEGRAEAADGRWWLLNPRGSDVDAGRDGSGTPIARYRPSLIGGRIRIADNGRYSVRPPMLGDSVRLRRGRRLVAAITRIHDVKLGAAAPDALPILIALQALLLEQLLPNAGGGGGGGAF